MPSRKRLLPTKRAQIIALTNANFSTRKIANELGLVPSTVARILQRFDGSEKSLHDRPRSGRPRKSTAADDRYLLLLSKKNRFLPATELQWRWKQSGGPSVHASTVRRRLIEHGFYGRIVKKKPFISKVNHKKRLKFATEHRDWTFDDWKKVLWTDETKIEFCIQNRRIYVRRTSSEAYSKHCLKGTVKHGGGSVMFWGAMAANGVGSLEAIDYKMTAVDYIDILNRNLDSSINSALENPREDWWFMQDNDPKHTAKKTSKFFVNNGIPLLEWPPQSPDLNPIEHLWYCLKADIASNGFRAKNKDELIAKVNECWKRVAGSMCENLVKSMPNRICAVLKAKGGPTRY